MTVEIIGHAPDWATFAKAAAATRLTDDKGVPISGGVLDAGGSWFWNAVLSGVYQPTGKTIKDAFGNDAPEMARVTGEWARVRINGDFPPLSDMMAVWRAMGVTVYELLQIGEGDALVWTADGKTPAPDYVATVGVIA